MYAIHIFACVCLNAQVTVINFLQVLGFLFSLSSRWILQGKAIPQLQIKDFPTGPGEEEKDLWPLLFSKTMSPGKGQTSEGTSICMPHSGKEALVLAFQPQWRFWCPSILWEVGKMGLKGPWRSQNWLIMCRDDQCHPRHSTPLGTESFKNDRLNFLPAQWNGNSGSK